ncbi:CLCA_X family protein [Pseudoalteromonas fenneropenaei]|uniref:CLCA_X family protein n=1 Tax=Pseudoalteromonas fenneropenaei TaxID=1737459 RepID=A0ABV7CF56_9GAMM
MKNVASRSGPDYRFGDQVDFDDIRITFGFNTIKIGSWVTKQERLVAANLLYDALADLTQILAIPPLMIGLRQTLNLAYGTGGRAGVQAHYDATSRTLAMAKFAGAGALAHEWWHAYDHYIAKHLFSAARPLDFASSMWLKRDDVRPHQLNELLNRYFSAVFLSPDKKTQSHFVMQAVSLDQAQGGYYYARPEELTARAFEWIIAQQQELQNSYLVSGVLNSSLAQAGGFPAMSQYQQLAGPLLRYFSYLGCLLHPK